MEVATASLKHSSSESSEYSVGSAVSDTSADEIPEVEAAIFTAINDGNRIALAKIFTTASSSTISQILLTSINPNLDKFYHHEPEILVDANELLGPSVSHLNAMQIACLLGDEEIAMDILEYMAKEAEEMESKMILYTFLGSMWGNGNTTLHLASFLGMADLVKRLLELGANGNKRNDRKYTAVDCADDDTTRRLFLTVQQVTRRDTAPASPALTEAVNKLRRTASLRETAKSNSAQSQRTTSLFVAKTASTTSLDQQPSGTSPTSPQTKERASSIASSSSPQLQQSPQKPKQKKKVSFDAATTLMYSAQSGDFETLKSILSDPKHNLSPNYQTESKQMSPLHSACCFNHLEIVKYLVSIGSDINIRDFDDWTPLHFAASEGNLEIVRYLCSFDHLELDAENSDGETVLEVIDEDEDGGEELRQEIELIFEEALTRQEAKGIKPPQQTRQEIPIEVPCTLPQKAKSASISDSTTAPTPAPVKSEQSTSKPPSTSTASNPQSSSSAPQKTVPVTQPEVNTTSSAPPSQPHPPKPAVSTNTRDVKEANTNPTPSPTVQQPTTQKAQVNEIVQTTSPASSPSKDQTSPQRNDSTPTKASTQIPSRTSSQSQSQSPTQQAPSSPIPQQQDPESEEPLPSTFRIASLVQAWKSLETQPNSATSAPFRNRNVSQRALNKIKQMEANGTSSPSSLASSMMDLTSNGGGPNSSLAFSGRRSSRSLARLNNGSNSNSNGSGNQSSSPTNSNDASRTASISLSESNAANNYIATSSPSTQNPQQDAQSQQQDAESDQGTTDRSKLESVRKLIASWNLKKK